MVETIESGKYQFLRCNYPNGDMVGHTGNYEATLIGVESVDLMLRRIMDACKKMDYVFEKDTKCTGTYQNFNR